MKPGDRIAGRFEVERLAGSGGMGAVYCARDLSTGERVALKLLHDDARDDDRFALEAQLLASLQHPGVVRHIAHGRSPDGPRFLAMEWLEGEDLASRLRRAGLTVDESVAVLVGVASSLAAAHERGIVHRDIKPSNIFLVDHRVDRCKLLDFGVARPEHNARAATQTGQLVGTIGYMAPEQVRSARAADSRADVFSLGCVLFECLTGEPAFSGDHPIAILAKILVEDAPRLGELRAHLKPLEELVARMLSKDPARRPADAAAVLAELAAVKTVETQGRAPAVAPRSTLTASERRLLCVVLTHAQVAQPVGNAPTLRGDEHGLPEQLAAAVRPLGGKLEHLADGSLLITLHGQGAAIDQAARAARCAAESAA